MTARILRVAIVVIGCQSVAFGVSPYLHRLYDAFSRQAPDEYGRAGFTEAMLQGEYSRNTHSLFRPRPWNECLHSSVRDGSQGSLICSHNLWHCDLARVVKEYRQHSFSFKHLRLGCQASLAKAPQPVKSDQDYGRKVVLEPGCWCADYTVPQKALNVSDVKQACEGSITLPINNITRCSNIHLERAHFFNLTSLRVLQLSLPSSSRIAPNAFEDLQSLVHLQLSNSNIGDGGLPSGLLCWSSNLRALFMKNNFLNHYPDHIFHCDNATAALQGLTYVKLSGNNFTELPKAAFGSVNKIRHLSLSHNFLNQLDKHCFDGLEELFTLDLSNNNLTHLSFSLRNLTKLGTLACDYNSITHLQARWFNGNPNLKKLSLRGNQIISIDGASGLLGSLLHLDLSYNSLDILKNDWWQFCHNLRFLQLSHNNITGIEEGAFSHFQKSIRVLNISGNHLSNLLELKSAFPQNPICLRHLFLANNEVTHINCYALFKFSKLEHLVLNNNQIHDLDNCAFQRLSHLKSLYIENNNVTFSNSRELFAELRNLRELHLGGNPIGHLPARVFKWLKNLTTLCIEHSAIDDINSDAFSGLESLKNLHLNHNAIQSINKVIFPKTLTFLNLANNSIKQFGTPRELPHLRQLLLEGNNLTILNSSSFVNTANVEFLYLAHNSLISLGYNTFEYLRHLRRLSLAHNLLDINFTVDIFRGPSLLEELDLTGNRITSVHNLFMHVAMRMLNHLLLRRNPLSGFPHHPANPWGLHSRRVRLMTLNLANCNLSHIPATAFLDMPSLSYVSLADNRLKIVPRFAVDQGARRLLVFDLLGNPIQCACNMRWLKDDPVTRTNYKFSECVNVMTGQPVRFDLLPIEHFVCPTGVMCDVGSCNCYTWDRQSWRPKFVNCSGRALATVPNPLPHSAEAIHLGGNNFSHLSFGHVTSTMAVLVLHLENCRIRNISINAFENFIFMRELHLEKNYLSSLPAGIFGSLGHLEILDLSRNWLKNIGAGLLVTPSLLSTLYLDHNRLTELSGDVQKQLQSKLYLNHIRLGNNPWKCPKNESSFRDWIAEMTSAKRIDDAVDIRCGATGPALLSKAVVEFKYRNKWTTKMILTIVSPCVVFVLMLSLSLGLGLYYRHYVQVLVFNVIGYRLDRIYTKICKCDAKYDIVFIHDQQSQSVLSWIRFTLLPELEKEDNRFRVFIPERDTRPGSVYAEELCDAVMQSYSSIILVTPGLFENMYAMDMFNWAYEQMASGKQRLITIEREKVKNKPGMDRRMRALLKSSLNLRPNTKFFWSRLYYLLPNSTSRFHETTDSSKCTDTKVNATSRSHKTTDSSNSADTKVIVPLRLSSPLPSTKVV